MMGCRDPRTPTAAVAVVPMTHPCCRAMRTKPLRFFRISVVTPGRQESDSAAPPMTMATALPVPFLDSRYPMARRVTGHRPAAERTTGAVGLPARAAPRGRGPREGPCLVGPCQGQWKGACCCGRAPREGQGPLGCQPCGQGAGKVWAGRGQGASKMRVEFRQGAGRVQAEHHPCPACSWGAQRPSVPGFSQMGLGSPPGAPLAVGIAPSVL